ncbi:MAG: hypothetical protein AB7P35_17585 [Hyphomonadaceae bacterium]
MNRAALTKPESYGWVHALAGAYVVVVGGFAVAAWLDQGEAFRAVMCAGAQVLAIVCAILARRAFTGQMPLVGWAMVSFTLGCAYWSALGIDHAWSANGAQANWVMVGFLAALEPLLFLAAEHIKEGREALREQFKRDEAETHAAIEAARTRDQRWAPRLATVGGAAIASQPMVASGAELVGAASQPPSRPAIVSTNPGYADQHAHALAIKVADPHLTEAAAAQIVGRSKSTIGAWWRKAGLTKQVAA